MHRDRIAGEGIDGENVELLRRLAFEREARIAQGRLNGRVATFEVGEIAVGNRDHRRIDVIEAIDVSLAAIGRDGAGPQADDADLERANARMQRFEHAADARRLRVIRRRAACQVRCKILGAVKYRAVDQRAVQAGPLAKFLHAQYAIEIALCQQRVAVELLDLPYLRAEREHQRAEGKCHERRMRPPHLEGEQGRARHKSECKLEIGRQHDRGDQADKRRTDRAPGGNHQVKTGEVTRRAVSCAQARHGRTCTRQTSPRRTLRSAA